MTDTDNKEGGGMLSPVREYVGRIGRIELEGMTFEVAIRDYKRVYGRDHLQIQPTRGGGKKWVRAVRLELATA